MWHLIVGHFKWTSYLGSGAAALSQRSKTGTLKNRWAESRAGEEGGGAPSSEKNQSKQRTGAWGWDWQTEGPVKDGQRGAFQSAWEEATG